MDDAPAVFSEIPYVLVTSVDSARDLRDFAAWLVECRVCEAAPETLGYDDRAAIVIDGPELLRWARHDDLLVGFDEVWLYGNKPTMLPTREVVLVAPYRFDEDPPSLAMLRWMTDAGCTLGLVDGYGINFAATDIGLARRLHLTDR